MHSLIAGGQLAPPPTSKITDPDALQLARARYVPIFGLNFLHFLKDRYTLLHYSLNNFLCNSLGLPTIAGGYAICESISGCDITSKLWVYKKVAIKLNIIFKLCTGWSVWGG